MPRPPLPRISSWSYSRYTTYCQCPFAARCKYVDKLKEPDSKAGEAGTRVHALAAFELTGKIPEEAEGNPALQKELVTIKAAGKLPEELETFEEEFRTLKKQAVIVNREWAFTEKWEPCGWFDRTCWLRIKVDAHRLETRKNGKRRSTVVHIVDHKTGNIYEDHDQQRSLYALGAFLIYPDAVEVTVAHWYLDKGQEAKQTWKVVQLPALKAEWLKRITAMVNDRTFAPRPGPYCKWCHFRKGNNGPCEF